MGTASRDIKIKPQAPGPGAYNPPVKITKEGPKYQFGKKYKENIKDTTPGPGSYEFKLNDKKAAPKYSIRPKTALPDERKKTPGPGSYEFKTTI